MEKSGPEGRSLRRRLNPWQFSNVSPDPYSIVASCRRNPQPLRLRLQIAVVVEDIVFVASVPPTGGEVISLHLLVGPINAPTVNRHAIDGGHHSGAMPPAGAVDEDRPVGLVVDDLQETRRRVGLRVALLLHWQVDVTHPGALCGRPGIVPRVLSQIHNRFNSERGQLFVVTTLGLQAPVEVVIDLPEVLDVDSGAVASGPLVIRNRAGRQRYCAYQGAGCGRSPHFV